MHRSALERQHGRLRTLPLGEQFSLYEFATAQPIRAIVYPPPVGSGTVTDTHAAIPPPPPISSRRVWTLECSIHGSNVRCACVSRLIRSNQDTGLSGTVAIPTTRETIYAHLKYDGFGGKAPWPNTQTVCYSLTPKPDMVLGDFPVPRLGTSRSELIWTLKDAIDSLVAKDPVAGLCQSGHHDGSRSLSENFGDRYSQMIHRVLSETGNCLDCDSILFTEDHLNER